MTKRKREAPAAEALGALGQGFLSHPGNGALRGALGDGTLGLEAFHGELVRLSLQLAVLGLLEDRELLLPQPAEETAARTVKARRHAPEPVPGMPGERGDEAWAGVKVALRGLFAEGRWPHLAESRLADPALRSACAALALPRLSCEGPEWLGGLYEQLLELGPRLGPDGAYALVPGGGKRRSSGSYFTPGALVQVLLDGALEPVVAETVNANPGREAEALRGLMLVDPACGTGHVLLAAARRLAAHVARWSGAGEREALEGVVRSCIHGLDLDPLAVELCKLALWLEVARPGLPPGTFEANIRQGNALLDGPAHFQDVLARGGFDVVLGNPPWIAHAGRAAQPLPADLKRVYARRFEAFAGYPTTHGLFAAAMPGLLREGGRMGLVLPSSVSELRGYGPTRRAHDRLCDFEGELTDFGEGRFPGVTQPSMALVSRRRAGGRTGAVHGAPWPVARPDLSVLDVRLLERLAALPTLPPALFGERGLQSDRALSAHFTEAAGPDGRFTLPLREGADIREFELLPPRLHADPGALGRRLRPAGEFLAVRVLIRQTARFPIAALSDGGAFRNSLLAGFELPGWPAEALVALLNASLTRWHHFMRFRDARQPVLPQVKVGHLRAIPLPAGGFGERMEALASLGRALTEGAGAPLRAALDALVAEAYGLGEDEARRVSAWHARG